MASMQAVSTPRASGSRTVPISRQTRSAITAYLLISPWIVGFLLYTLGGMLFTLFLSFAHWDIVTPIRVTGLANIRYMMADTFFYRSLANTVFYTVLGVPIFNVAALGLAAFLNVKLPGVNVFRTITYMPVLTPLIATAVIWRLLFSGGEIGILNTMLSVVGIPPIAWLSDPRIAKESMILMGLWFTGSRAVIYLAALQSVPDQLLEAARIDGAGWWATATRITFPMISPVIFFGVVTSFIGSFQIFQESILMTDGGPEYSTYFYVYHLYINAWTQLRLGYASALAVVLLIIVLLFTGLQFRLAQRWVYYEGEVT
jgi:multiple sugar transport system permease protein